MKVNRRVSGEEHCLIGTGHIYLLDDLGVEVRLEEDLVALRYEILWQPHDRWWSCCGGREGWTGRRIQFRDLRLVQNGHGDNASNDRDGQDDKGSGECLGCKGTFHAERGGCFLLSVLKVQLLDW